MCRQESSHLSWKEKYENMEPWNCQSYELSVLEKRHLTNTSSVEQLPKQDLVERKCKEKSNGHSLHDAFGH